MRRFRFLLSLLLGVCLLTQGAAVALASTSAMQMQMKPAAMAAMDMTADHHDMPCMDMDMSGKGMPAKCPAKCCEGKVCFDMTHRAQAQAAIVMVYLPLAYSPSEHNAAVPLASAPAESPPGSLLRPPIHLLS